jgi:hypothetical protein
VSALTRWVLAHKRIVVVLWLALAVAGAAAAIALGTSSPAFSRILATARSGTRR